MKGIQFSYGKLASGEVVIVGNPEENEEGLISITLFIKASDTNLLCDEHKSILNDVQDYMNNGLDIEALPESSKKDFLIDALTSGLSG
jgi:hypothetical protein